MVRKVCMQAPDGVRPLTRRVGQRWERAHKFNRKQTKDMYSLPGERVFVSSIQGTYLFGHTRPYVVLESEGTKADSGGHGEVLMCTTTS